MTTAVRPAVAFRAVVDSGVGPMMEMERVASQVGRAYRQGKTVTVEAMVTHTKHRDLTAVEQGRLVALVTEYLTNR